MYTAYLGGEFVITVSAALLSFFRQFKAYLQKQSKYYMLTVLIPKCREILKGMGFRFESNCSLYVLLSHSDLYEFWVRFSKDRSSGD